MSGRVLDTPVFTLANILANILLTLLPVYTFKRCLFSKIEIEIFAAK